MLSQLKIKQRLMILLVISAIGFAALAASFYRTVETVKVGGPLYGQIVQSKDLVADILPPPEYLLESFLEAYVLTNNVDDGDTKGAQACIDRLASLEKDFNDRHEYWSKELAEGEVKDALMKGSYETGKRLLEVIGTQLVPAARAGDKDKMNNLLDHEVTEAYSAHRAAIDHLVELANAQGTQIEQSSHDTLASQMWVAGAMAVGLLLAVAVVSMLLARSILVPLGGVVDRMREMSEGKGDLTVRLAVTGKDELSALSGYFNQFVEKLQTMVASVKQVAGDTAEAAKQLAETANAIASSSQEQASSLEETAASLEEITGTVKQNADNAQQANQLASSSHKVAEKGGTIMASTVGAIGEINEASGSIADIITTIDEIAFQTNLLALNAAVEAARAGEQGRGFAVVASEVRTLAQRSASAAKEIRGLIQDSTQKVEKGTKLANDTGETLHEIVGSVKKVTDLIAEISAASREQSLGVEQVNRAVVSMDQVVQSNAAQTEELSATAQSLADQANEILALMSGFRVDNGSPAPRSNASARAATPRASAPIAHAAPAKHATPRAASVVTHEETAVAATSQDEGFIEF